MPYKAEINSEVIAGENIEQILKKRKARRFLSQHKNEITRCESVMRSSLNTTGLTMLRQAKLARNLLNRL